MTPRSWAVLTLLFLSVSTTLTAAHPPVQGPRRPRVLTIEIGAEPLSNEHESASHVSLSNSRRLSVSFEFDQTLQYEQDDEEPDHEESIAPPDVVSIQMPRESQPQILHRTWSEPHHWVGHSSSSPHEEEEDVTLEYIVSPTTGQVTGSLVEYHNDDSSGIVWQLSHDAQGQPIATYTLTSEYPPELDPRRFEEKDTEDDFDAKKNGSHSRARTRRRRRTNEISNQVQSAIPATAAVTPPKRLRGGGSNPSLKKTVSTRDTDEKSMSPLRQLSNDENENSDMVVIDIMVVWTTRAECHRSFGKYATHCDDTTQFVSTPQTVQNMYYLIHLAIAETNTAYHNSGIHVQLQLVHAYRDVGYVETGHMATALSQVTNRNDGHFDSVHAQRDLYGADMVALLVHDTSYCGMAWLGDTSMPLQHDRMFSVTSWSCATGYYSLGHELAHNMGCQHDRGTEGTCVVDSNNNDDVASFNYGWRDPQARFRSILSYDCRTGQCDNNVGGGGGCPRRPFFSNTLDATTSASSWYPMGDAHNDNARQINQVRHALAALASPPVAQSCTTHGDCDDGNVCNGVEECSTATGTCVMVQPPLTCLGTNACWCDPTAGCVVGSNLTVSIVTDKYPFETTWSLQSSWSSSRPSLSEVTLRQGGPYDLPYHTYTSTDICGPPLATDVTSLSVWQDPDIQVDFTIQDDYGDGICCDVGTGSYTVTTATVNHGSILLAQGGDFGSSETQTLTPLGIEELQLGTTVTTASTSTSSTTTVPSTTTTPATTTTTSSTASTTTAPISAATSATSTTTSTSEASTPTSTVSTAATTVPTSLCSPTIDDCCWCDNSGSCRLGSQLSVQIKTDQYPLETKWELWHAAAGMSATKFHDSPPYVNPNTTYPLTSPICGPPVGHQVDFVIYDSHGDGMCCSAGHGSYTVFVDSTPVLHGGEFQSSETKSFTIASTASGAASTTSTVVTTATTPVPPSTTSSTKTVSTTPIA
eukprot:CAMPEP_0172442964 /NCGR_PEP_ID=MMETSP1065-20121228/3288_1 /TAXON_ID=265537 /ORGANISM="Amphiprora paludosa, Strain CCMP125" /LENGTH=981 /DNA_ID=CAMNT_0013193013 /DNA_START=1269 /DNA_END=4211 /DNA_ORIENTATION=+